MAVVVEGRMHSLQERRKTPVAGAKGPSSPVLAPSADLEFMKQTAEITHETFHALLLDQGVRVNGYSHGVVEPSFSSEVNKKAYLGLRSACRHFMKLHSQELVQRVDQLDLSDSMFFGTFHRAMFAMFSDDVNWGRLVALFCFAVLVAVKAYRETNYPVIESVEGWLKAFICSNMQPFIAKQNGWVS